MEANLKRLVVGLLFIPSLAWAAPDTTMSITPVAVSGATISASDENSRNNEISTKFNNHTHSDITQFGNTVKVGDGNAGDKTIQANTDDSNKPFIRWDDTNQLWVSSRDGVTVESLMVMTGADLTQSVLPQSPSSGNTLQFNTGTDQWDAQTLTVAGGGTGNTTMTDGGVLLGSGTDTVTAMAVLASGSIIVGDGTTDPVSLAAFTSSTGTLKHESGGVEADISAIAKGGIVTGTGTGTMGITTVGTNNQYLVADSTAGGGVSYTSAQQYSETAAVSTAALSSNLTIAPNKRYRVVVEGVKETSASTIAIRFNDDTGGNYDYKANAYYTDATGDATAESVTGTSILMTASTVATGGPFKAEFIIETTKRNSDSAFVTGSVVYLDSGAADYALGEFAGVYDADVTIASFEISTAGDTFTGNVYVYEME